MYVQLAAGAGTTRPLLRRPASPRTGLTLHTYHTAAWQHDVRSERRTKILPFGVVFSVLVVPCLAVTVFSPHPPRPHLSVSAADLSATRPGKLRLSCPCGLLRPTQRNAPALSRSNTFSGGPTWHSDRGGMGGCSGMFCFTTLCTSPARFFCLTEPGRRHTRCLLLPYFGGGRVPYLGGGRET